jgi:hypothetical protein
MVEDYERREEFLHIGIKNKNSLLWKQIILLNRKIDLSVPEIKYNLFEHSLPKSNKYILKKLSVKLFDLSIFSQANLQIVKPHKLTTAKWITILKRNVAPRKYLLIW